MGTNSSNLQPCATTYQSLSPNIQSSQTLSFLSYNILSDCCCHLKPLYPSQWFGRRNKLILQQLQDFNADIMCLQEVDHFDDFYKKAIANLGYDFFYTKKLRKDYGNLIAWKRNQFTKLFEESVYPEQQIPNNFTNKQFYVQQGTNVQFVGLVRNQEEFIIVNHHPNYKYEVVKFFEIAVAMNLIQKKFPGFLEKNIIMCGDFNSTPQSDVVKLIENPKGNLSVNYSLSKGEIIQMQEICDHFIKPYHQKLPSFKSAYLNSENQHPEFTIYTLFFKGTLDYIFYNNSEKSKLKVNKILKLDTTKELQQKGIYWFPNQRQPSDHIPLFAEFFIII